MTTKIKIDIEDAKTIARNHGLLPGGKAQKFFTNELFRVSDQYTPFDSGILKDTAFVSQDGTYIEYNTPYARYLWYGKLMVDPITHKGAFFNPNYGFWSRPGTPKVLTETDLNYQGAPLRGSHWVIRAYIDNKDSLLTSLENFINQQGGD